MQGFGGEWGRAPKGGSGRAGGAQPHALGADWAGFLEGTGLCGSYDWLKPLFPTLSFSSGAPLKKITFLNIKTKEAAAAILAEEKRGSAAQATSTRP